MCSWLLARGAQAHVQDLTGNTPLSYASARGHEDIVNLLTSGGGLSGSDCGETQEGADVKGRTRVGGVHNADSAVCVVS